RDGARSWYRDSQSRTVVEGRPSACAVARIVAPLSFRTAASPITRRRPSGAPTLAPGPGSGSGRTTGSGGVAPRPGPLRAGRAGGANSLPTPSGDRRTRCTPVRAPAHDDARDGRGDHQHGRRPQLALPSPAGSSPHVARERLLRSLE